MGQHIYWHAPLWEVLLAAFLGLVLLVWLVVLALRRPDLGAALSAINPALDDQPLFFFDYARGVTCLNHAAQRTLKTLPAAERQFLTDALTETLLEAYEEARPTQQKDWPESGHVLVAAPVSRRPDEVTGVFALVTTETPLPPADSPVDEPLALDAETWAVLGPTLRVHRARPVVHVRRPSPEAEGNAGATWQEYRLTHLEEALLRHLLEQHADVQTSETLFHVVWPDEVLDGYGLRSDQKDRLRHLVFQLRQHVEPDLRNPRYICTAHGVGYVLYLEREPDVQ